MDELLLSIRELTTQYITEDSVVHAVNGISLELKTGGSVGSW
jgi:ABC-type dipeptide/oligopeptide/nickel transport system ATPase component